VCAWFQLAGLEGKPGWNAADLAWKSQAWHGHSLSGWTAVQEILVGLAAAQWACDAGATCLVVIHPAMGPLAMLVAVHLIAGGQQLWTRYYRHH